ncbi:MAG: peptide chain release factor 2 [Thermoanaerobacteraceae bacterium]|nr:peptide chain release factor 2 [Thermoanaerobacteraceae bacterium]
MHFEIDKLNFEIERLEQKTVASDFWDDQETAQKILQEMNNLKSKLESYTSLVKKYEDLETLLELCIETDDDELEQELAQETKNFIKLLDKIKLETLLSGKYDAKNAILSLHAGAGGTEAQDWVGMLLRMYTRWAEDKGYKVTTLDMLPGDEAGIKSVTILVEGMNAYGYLKSEKGVHRLVRISPFDAAGRRHTSFASADVMPEIDDGIEVDIKQEDLKIDTFRAGGAGGQHVNKTESAVRITHIPSGIVVSCQNERSQQSNRNTAMKILRAKLFDLYQQQQQQELDKIRGAQKEIAWGSQIRSYVFHPYSLVKDHRTNVEVGNVQAVIDGELDEFINAYLKFIAK